MTTSDLPSCAEPHLDSFEQSFAAANYTRGTLKNYRSLVRRLGRLLDAEGIRPATLTPDLADRVAREAFVGSKST
jgi:integrase/recombinase XerD